MKKKLALFIISLGALLCSDTESKAQISKLQDYLNNSSPTIGTFQGITFREAGFSGLYPIAGTNGKEFWTLSDRGVNIDDVNANPAGCHPTYDKMYAFPGYAPKIHRIRINGNNLQILQTITIRRPNGTNASGILNPTGLGSTAAEVASTDTVLDCTRFNLKTTPKDTFGLDPEGIVVDKDGNFWICEEGGATIWKVNQNGILMKRYTPFANLSGVQSVDVQLDTVFKYRKNNRGFEGIAITPNGKIYALIQSPVLYPNVSTGENSRVHRIIEIDPATNAQRMFAYLNDGIIGASGSNQVRLRDWKIGDMAAINDSTFLVLEAALRGTTDIKRMYLININQATVVNSGLYGGLTLEALVDSTGLAGQGLKAVKKTLVMDLLANGWPAALDKAEGLAIINDSTIAISNDNDFGQVSALQDGVATATNNVSHLITYSLNGANKLANFSQPAILLSQGITGISSSKTPYLKPIVSKAEFISIISVGDTAGGGYKMAGTPDGTGAFDNGNGTFTLLVNHEFGNAAGVARAHGAKGAFVSKWVINKSDLSVVSGSDLISKVNLWNGTGYTLYNPADTTGKKAFNRFCSADLPAATAFYNASSNLGTVERIFMNGEESGNEGRAFGHIATGSNAGTTYELPSLGKFSWENSIANPTPQDNTIVAGTDDSTPGQVYIYVGTKTNSGSEVDKAGLTNGKLYGVSVSGLTTETSAGVPSANTAFTLIDLGVVRDSTGAAINSRSNNLGVTTFLRPEDGAWDPANTSDFYFVTTNAFNAPSRLWKLHFSDISKPAQGGTITAMLDGTEGQQMLDNLTIDNFGHVLLQEDVGGNAHLGKIWQYTIATDNMLLVANHDSSRFLNGAPNFLTQDEEASGIVDVQSILGAGKFLLVDQAHYSQPGELVEGGQILAMYNPDTYNSNPEITVVGNTIDITDGDVTPVVTDNTNFGNVSTGGSLTKTFTIKNTGAGVLNINNISFSGTNAAEFTLLSSPVFPLAIAANATQSITVKFAPLASGSRTSTIAIISNDFDESSFDFALSGISTTPEINVQANAVNILNGDVTPGSTDNTDFLNVNAGGSVTRLFVIQNTGNDTLKITGISFNGTNAVEFSVVSPTVFPLNIGSGSNLNLTIKFAPLVTGKRSATIKIANNDLDEASYDFALSGTAVAAPAAEVNIQGNDVTIADGDVAPGTTDNTDFGNVKAGETVTRTFAIQSTGTANLMVSDITISGPDANAFSLVFTPIFPVTITTGSAQFISVKYDPNVTGVHNATVNITCNDNDEGNYDFAIKGTAISTGIEGINVSSFLKLYPNPTSKNTTLSMRLNEAEHIRISVSDMQGRNVISSADRDFSAGLHDIELQTAGLGNGIYFVLISSVNKSTWIKLQVSH